MDRVVIYNDAKKTNKTTDSKGKCLHHRISKSGGCRPTIFNNDTDKYSICTICGEKFQIKFFTNEEVKKITNDLKELNNQNNVEQMTDFFSQLGEMLQNYRTDPEELERLEKLRNIAENQGNVRKKKNNNSGNSPMYGSWG